MNSPVLPTDLESDNRLIRRRVKIQIPQKHHQQPFISQLASLYHLKINIVGALLGQDGIGGGWFDLELEGRSQQVKNGLIFLIENGIIIWQDSIRQYDGW
ncbi:NIL domain-containing protein [Gloeocapsa sp. PCC 73106]|uniref:NIL domain-containing protein n=1 Tax=Gloeocapsa sp. PCC 73106 TaxID=102232 RepID=UPI0002ACC811|nr:NIL domain-containing protein [Gloeocapsa sp. PCC 73106]ELR98865.1 NIL domain-containing protein [Gloeocapsa sp. PCC 73106]